MHKAITALAMLGLAGCLPTNVPSGMLKNSDPGSPQALDDLAALAIIKGYQLRVGITRPIIIYSGEISDIFTSAKFFGPPDEGVCVKVKSQLKLLQSAPTDDLLYVRVIRSSGRLNVVHKGKDPSHIDCNQSRTYRPLPQIASLAKVNDFGPE